MKRFLFGMFLVCGVFFVSSQNTFASDFDVVSNKGEVIEVNEHSPSELSVIDGEIGTESAPQPRTIFGADNRIRVNNTSQYPYSTIVKLYMKFPNGGRYEGSGSLIGNNTVLTAGHCVYSKNLGGWATTVEVAPGMNEGYRPFGTAYSNKMYTTSGWFNSSGGNSNVHDVGVIKLDREIGKSTGYLGLKNTLSPSDNVTLTGYHGVNYMQTQTGKPLSVNEDYVNYTLDTKPGSSGSPVYSNNYVTAINAGETNNNNFAPRLAGYRYDFVIASLYDNVHKGNIDLVNMNSLAYQIKGWFATSKNISGTTPYLFFIDANSGKEITRQKMKMISRPDVNKVHPTVNYNNVGWQADGATPEALMGKKYKIMVRYSGDSVGNASTAEYWFPQVYTAPTKKNNGSIDKISGSGNTRTIVGWHSAWNAGKGKYRYLFVMQNGKEIARYKVTQTIKRPDVQKHMGNEIIGAGNSGFSVNINISNMKGKKVKFMHRYTNDPAGNGGISDFTFPATYTL